MLARIHAAAFYVASRPGFYFALLFLVRAIILTVVERFRPAHQVPYRKVVGRDLLAGAIFILAIVPGADFVNRWFAIRPVVPLSVSALPLLLRFVLYLVIADFGHYWVHRLMHTPHLWRVHKWHHYPTYMYWLAGVRGSLLQTILVNVPYLFAGVLLDVSPWWMFLAILTKNTLQNDWMHINVNWGGYWLEWLVVTPRYHHVHHSDDPAHYRGHLAALFPIWDRLFGTYVNPEEIPRPLSFGIGERVPAIRLAIGI